MPLLEKRATPRIVDLFLSRIVDVRFQREYLGSFLFGTNVESQGSSDGKAQSRSSLLELFFR